MFEDWISVADDSWLPFLQSQRDHLENISQNLLNICSEERILPAKFDVLRCLALPLDSVRVVIVGQDPYPNRMYACGLAFAVGDLGLTLPKSLQNIRTELIDDIGCEGTRFFDLTKWHNQGVLLINRVLTVEEGSSNSHINLGWEEFTSDLLKYLQGKNTFVAILWGNAAQVLKPLFDESMTIKSVHPSPLSAYRGFFNSKPFSRTNEILINHGIDPIDWCAAFSAHE